MNTNILQFTESANLDSLLLDLLQQKDEAYYQPKLVVGDTVNVFDGDQLTCMTIMMITGKNVKEYTLQDSCGFMYLAESWRWTEDLGDILKTKTSMRHKRNAGWGVKCCCSVKTLSLKKAA